MSHVFWIPWPPPQEQIQAEYSLFSSSAFTNKFFMAFSLWTSKVIKLAKVILITLVLFFSD